MLRVAFIASRRLARDQCNKVSVTQLSITLQNNGNREYSAAPPPQRPSSFIGKMVENFREEIERNKKLKQSIKDFRNDMDDIENSEALQKAREKYKAVEEETADRAQKAKQKLGALKKKVQDAELLQKAGKVTEEASKQALRVGQTISKKGEELTKTETYKAISDTARLVKDEIDQTTFGRGTRVYRSPPILKMRIERDLAAEAEVIAANTDTSEVVLHKDSKFAQSWDDFKNNNPYVNRVMEWRTKLDESDNPLIQASMLVKDKAYELFGGVFQRTELSETLTEICKMDPNFDKERFLLECEFFIIPNILEAMLRPDLKVLQDWCYERTFSIISEQFKKTTLLGLRHESKVLDVDLVDLLMGKVMDEGPVLAISFQCQQITCVRNSKNEVVEGDPTKVMRVHNVWIMCRDQSEMNSHVAWRLLDFSSQQTEQFL